MSSWIRIARLTQKKGLQGRFVAHVCQGLPFLLAEGMSVFVVPPSIGLPRALCVASIDERRDLSACISFVEELDPEEIAGLCDKFLLVEKSVITQMNSQTSLEDILSPSSADEGSSTFELTEMLRGLNVVDVHLGPLGSVLDIQGSTHQKCLCVELSRDCTKRFISDASLSDEHSYECLIPLVDEFVTNIDFEKSHIEVEIPKSLLELAF